MPFHPNFTPPTAAAHPTEGVAPLVQMTTPTRHVHQQRPRVRRNLGVWKSGPIGTAMAVACVLYISFLLLMDRIVYPGNSADMRQVLSLTNSLLMQDASLRGAWITSSVNGSPALFTSLSGPSDAQLPLLSVGDLEMVRYLSSGSVNDVVEVRFRDPSMAEAYGLVNHTETLVLKMVYNKDFGHNEITSLERLNQIDAIKAQYLHLPRPIWMERNATNPYYCSHAVKSYAVKTYDDDDHDDAAVDDDYALIWNEEKDCIQGEGSLPFDIVMRRKTRERFRASQYFDVILMPRLQPVYIYETAKSMRDIQIYMHSLLEILQATHAQNVNNIDLQMSRNIFVNKTTGRAILFDWNALIEVGQKCYDSEQNDQYAPPEAWLEGYFGIDARNTNIHAMDIWQLGIVWASLLYHPCYWDSTNLWNEDDKDWLSKVILTFGGNTVIPINDTAAVDLAVIAGFPEGKPPIIRNNKNFEPSLFLVDKHGHACTKPTWYIDSPRVPPADKELAIDILRRFLVLSPADRPTATELLQHPIWDDIRTPLAIS